MLNHPTLDKLQQLKLTGMVRAWKEQNALPEAAALPFEERLGLLVDRELTERDNRRMQLRLKQARLKQTASIEDIDFKTPRGLDRSLILKLADCEWVANHLNVLITGPTGVGKTYLACALAHKACREGYSSLYVRLPRLLQELDMGRADGRYARMMRQLAKVDVLSVDDWGLPTLTDLQRRDILELLDDRYNLRATVITSQLPVAHWHEAVGDPTLADAILDRVVHNSYKITLTGNSMRKQKGKLTADTTNP
ncbi:MAG: IS21-like element helper ATPase IstB [Pseudomonadota bacterium]